MNSFKTNYKETEISEELKKYIPIFSFSLFGILFSIKKYCNFGVGLNETYPYVPDGDEPYVFIDLGYLDVVFRSSYIYKKLYKYRYNINLEI
jgi:hypothetical protein